MRCRCWKDGFGWISLPTGGCLYAASTNYSETGETRFFSVKWSGSYSQLAINFSAS